LRDNRSQARHIAPLQPAPLVAVGMSSIPLDLLGFGLIIAQTFLAASQGIAVKFGLMGLTPYTLLLVRCILATFVLLAIAFALRCPYPRFGHTWFWAIILGTFQVAVAGSLFFWALQYVPVGRTIILTSTQPFLTVIAAHFLIRGEKITWRKVTGLCLGFAGVFFAVVIRGADLAGHSLIADIAVLTAAVIWTGCSLLVKRIGHHWHMMSLVTVQMAASAVAMLFIRTILEPSPPMAFTPQAIGGLLYLATFGSVGAFFVAFYVIRRHEVGIVSSFSFLQPLLGVVLSAAILGEHVGPELALSLLLVASGLLVINWRFSKPNNRGAS
jgi:O-acetylserine/cysteine efflux transporter